MSQTACLFHRFVELAAMAKSDRVSSMLVRAVVVVGAVSWLSLLASGCSDSCEPGGPAECHCGGSTDFEYSGECAADGTPICDCPDAPPRVAECGIPVCEGNFGELEGSWQLVDVCPLKVPWFPEFSCDGVSAVTDLVFEGSLQFTSAGKTVVGSIHAKGRLTADQSPGCGTSCGAIAHRISTSVSPDLPACQAGEDDRACECSVSSVFLSETSPSSSGLGITIGDERVDYCADADSLVLVSRANVLLFERTE